jgi:hypothetical protein
MEKGKGLAALILASKKPTEEVAKKKESGDEGEMDEGLLSAADEMISAIEGKDSRQFAESLKSFLQMCDY